MRRLGRMSLIVAGFALTVFGVGHSSAAAGEVLVNGNLEVSVSPVGWSLDTFITGVPGSTFPSVVEHSDGVNNPPDAGLGLLLHPQRGNQFEWEGQMLQVNLVLEQTFVSTINLNGRVFTMKGDAFLQDGYSGIVDPLSATYPRGDYNENFLTDAADYTTWRDAVTAGLDTLPNRDPGKANGVDPVDEDDFDWWRTHFGHKGHDAIASPTVTKFEMQFLDVGGAPLGSPVVFDLRDDPTTLAWRTHTLVSPAAPAGARQVRVRASALNMIGNGGSMLGQDVYLDNFSLRDNIATGLERLTNANLNTPGSPLGWTLFEGPTVETSPGVFVTADSAAFINFANRKVASATPNPTPPPDFLSESTGQQGLWLRPFVNATQFEPDIPTVDAILSQVVSATEGADYEFSAWAAFEEAYGGGLGDPTFLTFMKMEFLNAGMGVLLTEEIDLFDEGAVNNESGGVSYDDWNQYFVNGTAPEFTAFVKVSLGATGMYDSLPAPNAPQSGFFDEMSLIETLPGAGSGQAGAVPEPASVVLLGIALGLIAVGRRRSLRSS